MQGKIIGLWISCRRIRICTSHFKTTAQKSRWSFLLRGMQGKWVAGAINGKRCPCVPLYAPVWRFLSKGEELPHKGRKSAEKRILKYHKMRRNSRDLKWKNDCRLKTGIKPVKKALKSPQCGDFLQVLVLRHRRRFVRHRKKKWEFA